MLTLKLTSYCEAQDSFNAVCTDALRDTYPVTLPACIVPYIAPDQCAACDDIPYGLIGQTVNMGFANGATLNLEQFNALVGYCSELIDHRDALIYERVFSMLTLDNAYVIAQYDAADVFNITYAPSTLDDSAFITAESFDSESAANARFIALISERMTERMTQ